MLPFIPGQIYDRRRDIHDVYGGNWQSGIAPSKEHPYIFIFTGKSGHQHGYEDGWDNKYVFSYTGEGQDGNMDFLRGNLALRDHVAKGKRVFLFEFEMKGYVKFVDELQLFDYDYFESHDTQKRQRTAIKFFMQPVNRSPGPKRPTMNVSTSTTVFSFHPPTTPSSIDTSSLLTSAVTSC